VSYAAKDLSEQDSNPVLLYKFVRGATTWRYVALPQTFATYGETWTPAEISSAGIQSTGDVPKDPVTVTLPITNPMAAAFLAYAPDEVTAVTIFRTNYDDPTNKIVVFMGRVLSAPTSVATVTLTCENMGTSMRRMGLRQTYQRTCRHMLYGPGCNVDKAAHALAVNVSSVVGNVVQLSGGVAGSYVGGNIKASDGTLRMIVGQDGPIIGGVYASPVLTLMRTVLALLTDYSAHPSGFTATIYPGCDKSTVTCRTKFANIGNFGGFPGITGVNPMNGTSNVF
jgi:uncharacterized phage protein (TIGR02218 family)